MTGFDPNARHDVEVQDIVYAEPGGQPLLARVYRPAGVVAPLGLPVLVDVHGGAWTYFDRTADLVFDTALAASGMVVVALDFRCAPEHRYPACIADVVAGVRWTRANAGKLGVRADSLGLIGGSTGGHILMLAALRASDPRYSSTRFVGESDASSTPAGPKVGAPGKASQESVTSERGSAAKAAEARVLYALPLWPILDPLARYRYLRDCLATPGFEPRDRFFQPDRLLAAHDGFFGNEAEMAEASVLRIVRAREFEHLPPIWIAHPELDQNVTREMTDEFAVAYRQAGAEAEVEVFSGVGHSFANFPGDASHRCIQRMKAFIARQLAKL